MIDHNGRKIDYLRISVTDRCNLRCKYCMPDGIRSVPMSQILTFEEILAIVREAASIGIRCVRLTGGEPLVRLGMPDLVRKLKAVPGIEKVTMTTNGILLQENLPALTGAGLDAVNISLDTMDRAQYRAIAGTRRRQYPRPYFPRERPAGGHPIYRDDAHRVWKRFPCQRQ